MTQVQSRTVTSLVTVKFRAEVNFANCSQNSRKRYAIRVDLVFPIPNIYNIIWFRSVLLTYSGWKDVPKHAVYLRLF